MSWQSYVDDQLISTKMIKNAVIAGHDGNIWAHSAGFPVSAGCRLPRLDCSNYVTLSLCLLLCLATSSRSEVSQEPTILGLSLSPAMPVIFSNVSNDSFILYKWLDWLPLIVLSWRNNGAVVAGSND